MKQTRIGGLYYWGQYQPDRRIDFNGFFWQHDEGGLLIDPLPLTEEQLTQLEELGGVKWILVSNADHLRAAPELKARLGALVLAPALDRERFADQATLVDQWYESAQDLPAGLVVHWIRGGKSPAEPFFQLAPLDCLFFADVVRSHVSGELMLLPAPKLQDRALVVDSLAVLADMKPQAILLGDGDCLFRGADSELARFRKSL